MYSNVAFNIQVLFSLLFQIAVFVQADPRPNIVIMLADDLGYGDVEFNNPASLAKTPNLIQMATSQNSAVFTNMHSEAACTPSRVAILTSRSPVRDCVWGAPIQTLPLFRPETPSVVQIAKANGYRTLFLGKFLKSAVESDPRGWPSALGFENWTMINQGLTYDFPCACENPSKCFLGHVDYLDIKDHGCFAKSSPDLSTYIPPRYQMEAIHLANRFDQWLASLNPTDKFFVQISFRSVHKPFVASPELRQACINNEVCNDMGRVKTSLELDYGGCVHSIDQAVGLIRASLRTHRPDDYANTMLIFTSDNGPEAGKKGGAGSTMGMKGRKLSMFEGLLRVPAVMEWPSVIRQNKKIGGLASIMDFSQTFSEALRRVSGEKDINIRDGVDLFPLLTQNPDAPRSKPLGICSCTNDETLRRSKTLCESMAMFDDDGQYKLIARREDPSRVGGLPSKAVPQFLYDVTDPINGETNNLKGYMPDYVRNMKSRTNKWLVNVFQSFRLNCAEYYPDKKRKTLKNKRRVRRLLRARRHM